MTTRQRFTDEQIREIGKQLGELPPVPGHTKRQAIAMLAGEIRKLQERGYNLRQVAEQLRSLGLNITSGTLGSYLPKAPARKPRRLRRGRPASGLPERAGAPSGAQADPDEHRFCAIVEILRNTPSLTYEAIAVESGIGGRTIRDAVRRLDPELFAARQRDDVYGLALHRLRENPELTYREVAEEFGLNISTLRNVVNRLDPELRVKRRRLRGIPRGH